MFLVVVAVLSLAAVAQPEIAVQSGGSQRTAGSLTGRIIVKLASDCRGQVNQSSLRQSVRFGIPSLDLACVRLGVDSVWPLFVGRPGPLAERLGCDLAFGLHLAGTPDAGVAVAALGALPEVDWAGPDEPMRLCDVPDDFYYAQQWHLPKIGAPTAWDLCHGDSSVVIGLVDNGYEWHHPDLQENILINPAEDLNHNGRFDSLPAPGGDVDGIDQDSNGVADDVAGYNFIEDTPNPAPESATLTHSHGTHTWGIANAVTDNGAGVAGACWNCRGIGVRAGTGQVMSPAAVISGIYYLVARGARVLSLSFGSTSPSQPLEDACNFAWESGCLVVAGAGNNGNSNRFYPAAYNRVIAVAASDEGDYRPYWSNYGDWIDVTAPGNAIVSTMANHWYAIMSGTSMATPLVAGSLAWIWSAYPGFTNAQVESTLLAACEPMPESLYQQGLMGRGRISIGRVALPLMRCDLRLAGWRINDASGNGDGRLGPGETVGVIVTYANSAGWRDAASVRATLTCNGSRITVLRGSATFPDIPAGSSASCSGDSFVVCADPSAAPQELTFGLHVDAEPDVQSPDTAVASECGEPRLLIVDDDCGADYERYYTAACDSGRLLYRVHTVALEGSPPAETLRRYPVVVWFCGDDSTTTLQPEDRSALVSYLRAGGNLMLSGQSIARDLDNRQSAFLGDYLHAAFVTDSTGQVLLAGLPADPITLGDTIAAAGTGGTGNGNSLDGIRPVGGAEACARYAGYADTTVCGIIRFAGSYRLVFMSIPFEAIDHSASRYLQRRELLERVLAWFGELLPGVEVATAVPTSGAGLVVRPALVRAAAQVSLTAPFTGTSLLRLFSADGRLMAARALDCVADRDEQFAVGLLRPGVYLLVLTGNNAAYSQKFVVVD